MMNYYDRRVEEEFLAQGHIRTHPWTSAISDESNQYYNFINNPELIENSLEDFIPFDKYPAIQTFYELLRWLNGSVQPPFVTPFRFTQNFLQPKKATIPATDTTLTMPFVAPVTIAVFPSSRQRKLLA